MPRTDRKHLVWVRQQVCCVPGCAGPAEAHHVRTAANSGTGLKPRDRESVPACWSHHRELHDVGRLTFERRHRINLAEIAAWCDQASGTEMP